MGRYYGPACRLCRREGMKLFLKGARCNMSKCPIEAGSSAPGMHGARRSKMSDYGKQFREKQRLQRHYGLRNGQFMLIFQRALKKRGITGDDLLKMLEMRLDNLVYRFGFASSRRAARQLVLHEHVSVNGRKTDVPSMVLKAGGMVEIRSHGKIREVVQKTLEAGEDKDLSPWLALDRKNFKGEVIRIPTREEIASPFNEQLIVELCSK